MATFGLPAVRGGLNANQCLAVLLFLASPSDSHPVTPPRCCTRRRRGSQRVPIIAQPGWWWCRHGARPHTLPHRPRRAAHSPASSRPTPTPRPGVVCVSVEGFLVGGERHGHNVACQNPTTRLPHDPLIHPSKTGSSWRVSPRHAAFYVFLRASNRLVRGKVTSRREMSATSRRASRSRLSRMRVTHGCTYLGTYMHASIAARYVQVICSG